MNIAERHIEILKIIKKEGFADVTDLSKRLNTSSVTIRKDLKLLEKKNLLFRAHGRALPVNPYISENPVTEKEKLNTSEKKQIAIKASELIQANDHIIIASGTSVIEFARQIKDINNITVLSASLDASKILAENPNIEVIQLGGMVRSGSSSVVGPTAEKLLSEFIFTKLFLGVDGIDLNYGLTTTNAMEASLNKLMIKNSQQTIVLADASKFGRKGFGKICNIEEVDTIITDSRISENTQKQIEEKSVELLLV